MTTKLYQQDVYTRSWDAQITSVAPHAKAGEPAFDITLDRTAFFPEGGGQSCDLGMLGPYEVIDVQEDGGEVIHTVRLPDGMDGSGAVVGYAISVTSAEGYDGNIGLSVGILYLNAQLTEM